MVSACGRQTLGSTGLSCSRSYSLIICSTGVLLRTKTVSESQPTTPMFDRSAQTARSTETLSGPDRPLASGNMRALQQKRKKRASKGFYHANRRTRPSPLKLEPNVKTSRSPDRGDRHSFGSSFIAPLTEGQGRLRRNMPASSIYSRDTKGYSHAHTPVSPDFPSPVKQVLGNKGSTSTMNKRVLRAYSSHDSVRARIDEWTKRIECMPTSPSSNLKRALSDLGPRGMEDEHHQAADDDAERRPNKLRKHVKPRPSQEPLGAAPGGAAWI